MRKRIITEEQIKQLIEQFVVGTSARNAAYVCGISSEYGTQMVSSISYFDIKKMSKRA